MKKTFNDEILDVENTNLTFILKYVTRNVEFHGYDNEELLIKRKKNLLFSWKQIEPNFSIFLPPATNETERKNDHNERSCTWHELI